MDRKKRIYQVAIELNISHSDIIEFLNGIGEPGYSHMSEVDGGIYNKIISKYSLVKIILCGSEPITLNKKLEAFRPNKVTIIDIIIAKTID